ncbi:hypothetical protein N7494_005703 [Penicillium frequentans]|uniref:Uncharacterized protein n=1 Tax=Penicillium frequentans TaxID=3151616 RepID=A0AAD6CV28_9EURO|nr:hypothetical protein N7494_005703 [Penicillium glabrum]
MIHWDFNDSTPCLSSDFASSKIPSYSCSKIKSTGMSDVTSETVVVSDYPLLAIGTELHPVRHWFKSNMARGDLIIDA